MGSKCCAKCAVILCDCGAYHGTDGVIVVDSDRGPIYDFAQSIEQINAGDEPCEIVRQFALSDDAVDRLGDRCSRCERNDETL